MFTRRIRDHRACLLRLPHPREKVQRRNPLLRLYRKLLRGHLVLLSRFSLPPMRRSPVLQRRRSTNKVSQQRRTSVPFLNRKRDRLLRTTIRWPPFATRSTRSTSSSPSPTNTATT